jgi:hypothetical protein
MSADSSGRAVYSGAAPRAIAAKIIRKPVFRTVCPKTDHLGGWDPSSTLPCPDACPLMDMFGIYFCRFGVVCRRCKRLVPPKQLVRHLSHDPHKTTAGTCKGRDYRFVADHIMKTHRFDSATVFNSSVELSERIDGLEDPSLSYACPISGCQVWRAVKTTRQRGTKMLTISTKTTKIRAHVRSDHSRDLDNNPALNAHLSPTNNNFKCRYLYRPFKQTGCTDYLIFVEGWEPPATLASAPSVSPVPAQRIYRTQEQLQLPPGARFLQSLGYPQYVKSLNASNTRLRRLVQLPVRHRATEISHAPTRYLELGLCNLHDLIPSYLRDANIWLDQQHPQAREAFVHG